DHTSLCLSTGVFAERSKRYEIGIYRDREKWQFWGEPSFLSGQPVYRLEFWKQPLIAMMLPFRRTLDRPWNSVIVRYGPTGTEESFLDRKPPTLNDSLVRAPGHPLEKIPDRESLGEEWTARRDGEIYVYLNNPVLGIWGSRPGSASTSFRARAPHTSLSSASNDKPACAGSLSYKLQPVMFLGVTPPQLLIPIRAPP